MVTESTAQALDQLYKIQNHYVPNDTVREQLSTKTLTMVVGAACEGKSTVIAELVRQDNRFAIAGSFTTRDPRPDDVEKPYTYYPNTEEGLAQLFSRIGRREVVQFAVHPFSKHMYGTEITDYSKAYNVLDTFAGVVAGFREYGFKATHAVSIVTEPQAWVARFNERFPLGHPQRAGRRDEAIQSFEWSLAQTDSYHAFVENIAGKPEIAAQNIIDVTFGRPYDSDGARQLCQASLELARDMKA
jgi:guanylate kinase